jgi:hypothetical protein
VVGVVSRVVVLGAGIAGQVDEMPTTLEETMTMIRA